MGLCWVATNSWPVETESSLLSLVKLTGLPPSWSFCSERQEKNRAQDKCVEITSIDSSHVIPSPNPMFDHLLESSRLDDSYKWSNRISEEIGIIEMKIHTFSGALE